MHGYGVACFTAKCRRRAAAPVPHAFYILDVPSLKPPLPPMLVRHPRRGFLSSVSLCLPFPRRAVASSCAALLAVHSLLSPPCVDISIGPSLSLSRIPLAPAMHAALHPPCRAHLGCRARRSLATTESVGLQSVFSTSRGEPRSLAKTKARGFPGCFDCSWGGRVRYAWISLVLDARRYPPPVCFVSLSRGYGDTYVPLPLRRAHILRARQGMVKGAFRRELHTMFRRAVMTRLQYALGPLCVNFNYGTPREFMRHFAYFTGVAVEFGRSRSGTCWAPRMYRDDDIF